MMNIRVIYNYILVRLDIRQILPIDYIRNVKVAECNEPLIPFQIKQTFFCDEKQLLVARESVVAKLERIADRLIKDHGLYIRILELYRSPEKQQALRNRHIQILQEEEMHLTTEQIEANVNKKVSAVGGGHQTGGAVDLCLCDSNGNMLDMGTRYDEFNALTPTRSKKVSPIVKRNRELLLSYMKQEGFVNYPNEWWHYSYGDKMWAAYSNQRCAIYDIINLSNDNV